MTKKYLCPRCRSEKIIDLGDVIECVICKDEFEKSDLETFEDKSNILSVREKKRILDSIPNDTT